MNRRRETRPVKMITIMAYPETVPAPPMSELAPPSVRYRVVGERLRECRNLMARGLGRVNGSVVWAWRRIGTGALVLWRRLVPLATLVGQQSWTAGRRLQTASIRAIRRMRRRMRLYGRARRVARSTRSQDEALRRMDRLAWEVRVLQEYIQAQQEILLRLTTQLTDQGTDAAWVARALASKQSILDRSKALPSARLQSLEEREQSRRLGLHATWR